MASTLTTINASLVDSKVVAALRYFLPLMKSFSYQVDSNGRIQNDVIYVPIATDPSATSKTAGTAGTAGGTVTGTSVTLSNFYYTAWDATEGSIAPPLFANYWADKAAGAVYALCKQVIDAALAVITAANFGDTADSDKVVCAAADFGQQDLALLWKAAADKIKQREISLGLNSAYAASLMGDSNLGLILATSGNSFIQTAMLPQLVGMNAWCYPAFPSNSQNLGGAVFGRAAILVAAAPPAPLMEAGDGDIMERRVITDPESGLSVLYTMTGAGGGTVHGEMDILYGVAKGQNACVRLVSA